MRQTKAKQYRRQAEQWCFEFLRESFPAEVVEGMDRKELWALAFPETHYEEMCTHPWAKDSTDLDGKYSRFRLFKRSPRWIYKHIKKNPLVTKQELMEMAS
jgi:hypothetical protein